MPISLAKMATNTARVTFLFGGDDVTVVYYPGRVTEKLFAQLQGFSEMTEGNLLASFASFNETLCHLVQSWDIYEDDAQTQMFPLDPARMGELPMVLRIQVITAISGDIRPEEMAPKTTPSS